LATTQEESSKVAWTSGKLSLNFHPIRGGTTILVAENVRCPTNVPGKRERPSVAVEFLATGLPFHVTAVMCGGPMTWSVTPAFKSPCNESVPSGSREAFLTRCGPPTSMVELVPICQKFACGPVPLRTGAKNVPAVSDVETNTSEVSVSMAAKGPPPRTPSGNLRSTLAERDSASSQGSPWSAVTYSTSRVPM
jgi:hypothetical protein